MKLNKTSFFRNTAASVVGFVAFALPTLALADDGSSGGGGMALLIPRPAEFIPACIAFVIIWIVLAKFAWPSVVKAMDARENKIKSDLDDAAKSKADAAKSAKEAKRAIDEANHKADEIVAEAKKQAEAERSQVLAKAQKDAAATIAKAHDVVESERHKAMVDLSNSVVDLSVQIAGKIIGDGLSEQQQRDLAEKYLEEIGNDDAK
ncbi:MAG: ATP synthase F0 subunit B [Coriobacteriaceae bacterium]|jgi:F-type H+-transporting ATPase subunit b|uniref:F0F1 ATP synthase subunit B n=1 Tax=Atopobium sp. oral taxon 416 TaxID=712157 RepID=UPI000FF3C73F|nr:F0F1 ATP synthase subunit B [Atopobium sp. oral taxon 416]QUC03217.1 F0F1 ATP synthase subunit B [Atopobium sp. oral taxon 416]RRF98436.1 MAG: ATP synthase F0 subunit B [Coriobacteriaceae bacterium]